MYKDFAEFYREVFDENDEVKACGREKCVDLIEYCQSIKPDGYFGNKDTGFLDVQAIKTLAVGLCK